MTGGCCRACFKLIGQQCGGIHNRLGVCAQGLECFSNDTSNLIEINKPRGICRKYLNESVPCILSSYKNKKIKKIVN